MNIPEEINNLDRQYWIDKILGKFDLGNIKKKEKKSKSFKSFLNREIVNVFEFAPESIKNDEEIALLALDKFKTHIQFIGNDLKNNKDFILNYVKKIDYPSFFSLPLEIKEDKDVFFAYYKKSISCFRELLWDSKKFYNRETIKELLQINGSLMESLPNNFKDDIELAKIAIDQNASNIKFLNKRTTEKICVDKAYCKQLIEDYLDAFKYISLKLRGDKNFVLPYIRQDISFIEYLPKKLRSDKEFMEPFISSFTAFNCLGDELKKDEDLMLKAAKYHVGIMYRVDESLKNMDFYIKLVNVNPNTYKFFWKEVQKDPDIIIAFLSHEYCYDKEQNKVDPVLFLHPDELEICKNEYEKLPNYENLNFNKFVRGRYLNNILEAGLNKENLDINETVSIPKKLKI